MPALLQPVPRRALLAAAGASVVAALAACSARETAGTAIGGPEWEVTPSPVPPTPSPTPHPAHELDAAGRKAVEARFAGRVPRDWGLAVPGVVTHTTSGAVALTFDACGGPGGGSAFDAKLIGTLRTLRIPATLFLNSRWIAANPSLAAELAADRLFELGNHGTAHIPLSVSGRSAYGIRGTASLSAALDELLGNAARIAEVADAPVPWFRPGTAFYDDVAAQATTAVGLVPVNFSVNADAGATLPAAKVSAALAGVKAGDIVIGHMNRPGSGTSAGFAAALPRLVERGIRFTTLSQSGLVLPGAPASA
ncbi:polysaccharide deacetylase family protein [Sinomonas sp. ASV322]|uniref:polysaccharide deacetylase family protein n=1 Tax=Sinomonas sp. ASV322 TaxID=3041920 RepID=UPI0027DE2143|nr:polysaccharide deacetylase family protein [Sinomonas sp. ASV322]MDQ4500941.1 polysaccharide deacetylase family protein [Sinomonas sp. ASV322]